MKPRQTVCVEPVGLVTNNILWNDAEHAAAMGSEPVSPFKPGSHSDKIWMRHFNEARQCIRVSGYTQIGRRAA